MKRLFVFLAMFLFSVPDLIWAVYNLLVGLVLFLIGKVTGLKKLKLYGLNIAISVDQFFSVKMMGQGPDITISMALGVAKYKHEEGIADVALFWVAFAKFVNFLFFIQKDHVFESIETEESDAHTVIHLYKIKTQDPDWKALDKKGATEETLADVS